MSRDEAMDRLEQLGWEPVAIVAYTLLEKKSILHELEEKMNEVRDERQYECLLRPGSEEQDRAERLVQDAQHSVVETRYETTADQEDQGGTSRATTTTTGNTGLWMTPGKDVRVGLRPRQTVLRMGSDSRRGVPQVATAGEVRDARGTVIGNVAEGGEFTSKKVAQSDNERWFDHGKRQRSPVQREDDERAATISAEEER